MKRCFYLTIMLFLLAPFALAEERDEGASLREMLERSRQGLETVTAELERLAAELERLRQDLGHAPLWDERGLAVQPRMAELVRASREYGFKPATTPWQDEAIGHLGRVTWDEPGIALQEVAQALRLYEFLGLDTWEVTHRLYLDEDREDRAVGVLLSWGFKDDAVAGADYRATFTRWEGGWQLEALERRFHCRRGVSAEGLCL
jgi:hypothetical protein